MINPYEVMGLQRDASGEDVKRAYRLKALEWHPDRNRTPDAVARFQAVAEAYAILSDPHRRASWHSAESDAWLKYIEDGTPLPWEVGRLSPFDMDGPSPFDADGPSPFDADVTLPWENNDPFPWDSDDPLPWEEGPEATSRSEAGTTCSGFCQCAFGFVLQPGGQPNDVTGGTRT